MGEPVRSSDPDLEQSFFDRGESESGLIALHALAGEHEAPPKRWNRNPYVIGAGVAIGLMLAAIWAIRSPAKPADTVAAVASAPVAPSAAPVAVAPPPAPVAAPAVAPAPEPAAGAVALAEAATLPAPAPVAAADSVALTDPSSAASMAGARASDDDIAACRAADDKGRIKDVLVVCRKVMEAQPDQPDALLALARAALERGRPGYCLDLATRAVAARPDLADAYALIGTVEQERGRIAVARTNYKKYLELAPRGRYAADLRAVLAGL